MISKFNGGSIAMLSVLFCATTAFAQEDRGTPEQRAACAPDGLRQNKSDLSEACRSVFEQSAGPVAGRVK